MALKEIPPDELQRRDALVNAIRGLARKNSCSHRTAIKHAIQMARIGNVTHAGKSAAEAGVPLDEFMAITALIYG